MPDKRSERLHAICEELRKNPAFVGSLADMDEASEYVSDTTIENLLRTKAASLRHINLLIKNNKNKCGELTRNEKRLLQQLTNLGY